MLFICLDNTVMYFQINNATEESFYDTIEPIECLIRVAGCSAFMTKPQRKGELIDAICQYMVVENMRSSYKQ